MNIDDLQQDKYKYTEVLSIDIMEEKLDLLITEVTGMSSRLQEFVTKYSRLDADVQQLTKDNQVLKTNLAQLQTKVDYLENQSRRNNIVIRGVEGDAGEKTWRDVESKVVSVIQTNLGVDLCQSDIERAHRVFRSKAVPKPIVVKLLSYKKKEEILGKRYKLKGTDIVIQEDFSDRIIEERQKLYPLLK